MSASDVLTGGAWEFDWKRRVMVWSGPRPVDTPAPPQKPRRAQPHDPDKTPRPEVAHGTMLGYGAHRRDRTPICEPCREAARAYGRAHYRAARDRLRTR